MSGRKENPFKIGDKVVPSLTEHDIDSLLMLVATRVVIAVPWSGARTMTISTSLAQHVRKFFWPWEFSTCNQVNPVRIIQGIFPTLSHLKNASHFGTATATFREFRGDPSSSSTQFSFRKRPNLTVVSKEAGSSSFQAGHPGAPVMKAKNRSQNPIASPVASWASKRG
jgi:hypothetical protein